MIFVIDNYDSFTFNLVQYLGELGKQVEVARNDRITIAEIKERNPEAILISPGPCTPNEAGISLEVVLRLGKEYPILGVCLGHQAILQAFGGRIIPAPRLMHGKTSEIYHHGKGIYEGLPSPFPAARYHSLIGEEESLPDVLEVTAWTDQREIMGVRHKQLPIEGVQFHPESILTQYGKKILYQWVKKISA
ncbi:MAG: aminodeoxychorismate/anthranilate synthase component II [Thermicanus sp.]|nr:aminodeoxychorismate/anthranilate synthase component II [Thermicanus sp.]